MIATKRRQDILYEPVAPQLLKLTWPMIFGILSIMSLGLGDSYFISQLGTEQLAAIAFIAPVAGMATNVSLGMGMAISSLISRSIGSNRLSDAPRLVTDGYYLIVAISCSGCFGVYIFLKPIFRLIGADASTFIFIKEYMSLWLLAGPIFMMCMIASSIFRSIGDTHISATMTLLMSISNLILDPILIFGFGPIPAMGVRGAAIATIIAVFIGLLFSLYHLAYKERLLLLALPKWNVFKQNLHQLSTIGIPAILANAIVPLMELLLTSIVASYGYYAVAAFGVGTCVQSISLTLVYALSSTLPMFIGQNLGAKQTQRVKQALSISFKLTFIWQAVLAAILIYSSNSIAALFSNQLSVQQTIINYIYIIPVTYSLSGIIILINVSMNVLGQPRAALYINLMRLLCLHFPLAYLGSYIAGVKGIFIAISCVNIIAFFISYRLLNKVLKEQNII